MNTTKRYSPEVRKPAVRLVFEHQGEHESQWAEISSISLIQESTIRAYCLVEMWGDFFIRLGNIKSSYRNPADSIQLEIATLVCSVISNWTVLWVFCCITIARAAILPPLDTSRTRIPTKSPARSLLSIARLNIARSRW